MVVSEADLNRLDYYITAKQRLHNRQLFGTGTVCGLIVTCHPCGGGVVSVSPGYALGPCGEDIVVCAPDTVDVCALIQKCRALERTTVDCRPWGDPHGCEDVQESWVLAIRYLEQPSRNAPMLRAAVSCSCGGGAGCTCGGCTIGAPQPRNPTPIACAPTVVCETYTYEVFRAPAQPDCSGDSKPPNGRLLQRVIDCAADLIRLTTSVPQDPLNDNLTQAGKQRWSAYLAQFKAALHIHLTRSGTAHCALLEQLCQIVTPAATLATGAFIAATELALTAMAPIWGAALQDCICLSLLPPCPAPTQDPRLPLAVITVNTAGDCSIVEICNWAPLRKIVGSPTNIGYWLSGFSLLEGLREALFCACCQPLQLQRPRGVLPGLFAGRHSAAPEPAAGTEPLHAAGISLGDLGIFGKWLGAGQADPGDLTAMLRLAPAPGSVDALQKRVETLEAEVARLRGAPNQPPG
jgi:hypothetical protein